MLKDAAVRSFLLSHVQQINTREIYMISLYTPWRHAGGVRYSSTH
jgi:hypothetical protein